MNTPLGYNPVGESAPGLPSHTKQLPGHVSGGWTQAGGGDFGGQAPVNVSYPSGNYAGGYAPGTAGPSRFGLWSARIFMAFFTYMSLPVQLVLYPLAALPALGAGYYVLKAGSGALLGFDASMSNAWTVAWAVLLPAMRLETTIENQIPGYRFLRHLFRVCAASYWFYYFSIQTQGDPPQTAVIIALIIAVPVHFMLRSRLLRGVWEAMQTTSWLRKA